MAIDLQKCRDSFHRRQQEHYTAQENRRHQARTAAIAAITQLLPHYPQIQTLHLFGSVTRSGHFHDHSDIDIAVSGTDAASYFALWRDLEAACPQWPIDLREINQPSHFANTIREYGELIYDSQSSPTQS